MGKKILVIDDDPSILKLATTILQGAAYEVVTASDGEEGLKKAQTESPALIISDLMLPKLDGWRVCQKLKTDPRYKHIPVILSSSLLGDGTGKDEVGLGDAFVVKPFEPQALLDRVRTLLGA